MNYAHTPWSNLFNLLPRWVDKSSLPPELDCDLYRLLHDDTRDWSDEEVIAHYTHHGINEGRLASTAAQRVGFLSTLPEDVDILEIGPFTKPALRGDRVQYFDVLDESALIARAERVGYPTKNCPHIDFVSPDGDLAIVPSAQFDIVFSSHCIEHQPDLISHLNHVDRVLRPGGRYFVIAPDKRYCFDYFLEASTIDEVLRAFEERRKVHTQKSIFEHYALTTHSDTLDHWRGNHEDPNFHERANRAQAAVETFHRSAGAYVDVHAWQFTPSSMRSLLGELRLLNKINLDVERVYSTVWGQNEFNSVLVKPVNS